jgi:predicted  nucleic acid-binding Zn-ribbon protein
MGVIDTLGIADELAQDGVFTREQAERLARVSGRAATEAVATKSDIDALRVDIASFKTEVVGEFTRTRADLERAIAETRADLERMIAQTRSDLEHSILLSRRELQVEIQTVNRDTIKWFAGILLAHGIAVIAVTVTLVKLL